MLDLPLDYAVVPVTRSTVLPSLCTQAHAHLHALLCRSTSLWYSLCLSSCICCPVVFVPLRLPPPTHPHPTPPGVPKAREPHPDIGCWWTLYDYGLEEVSSWAADYVHTYPGEQGSREREREGEGERCEDGVPHSAGRAARLTGLDMCMPLTMKRAMNACACRCRCPLPPLHPSTPPTRRGAEAPARAGSQARSKAAAQGHSSSCHGPPALTKLQHALHP